MATKKAAPSKGDLIAAGKNKAAAAIVHAYGDIMVDLETLSTDTDGAIVSIGAVRFNETSISDSSFYRVITIQSNIDEGRTISGNTLKWWLSQDAKAKAMFQDESAVSLEQALDEFRAWVGADAKTVRMWGNGADFDCAMIKHAYGNQGAPWEFYNSRCFRTIKELPAAKKVPKPKNDGAHNALFDALAQAQHLQAIWAAGVGR